MPLKDRGKGIKVKTGLAENIKLLRKKKGWSQTELAAKTGSTLSHINKIETGKYTPSLDTLSRLAEVFEVTLDELATGNAASLSAEDLQNRSANQIARLIESLDEEDRQTLLGILRTMLVNRRIQTLIADKSELLDTPLPAQKKKAGAR